jgi:hypothetical protein
LTGERRDHAVLMVEAYVEGLRALGAVRAIELALRGEPWTPLDERREAELLFGT